MRQGFDQDGNIQARLSDIKNDGIKWGCGQLSFLDFVQNRLRRDCLVKGEMPGCKHLGNQFKTGQVIFHNQYSPVGNRLGNLPHRWCLGLNRELNFKPEGGSLIHLALKLNFPLHGFNQFFGNDQAKTSAAKASGVAGIRLSKWLKQE